MRNHPGHSPYRLAATFLPLLFFLLLWSYASAQEETRPLFEIKYLRSISGAVTEAGFSAISNLHLDGANEEVYILDSNNNRVVITDLEGVILHHFKLFKRTGGSPQDLTVDRDGNILVLGERKVAVFNYRGVFKGLLDLSFIPEPDTIALHSIVADEEGYIYLGMKGSNARIVTLDGDGGFVSQIEAEGRFINVSALTVSGDYLTFLDPAWARVWKFDREGNEVLSFGRISSLLGGFSLPSSLDVDEKGRFFVLDGNRKQLILFDQEGTPLWEFGGPRVFRWPRVVTLDHKGRIYVAESGVIRVFELVELPGS
jgi:sugar lactone lactonase YvrE